MIEQNTFTPVQEVALSQHGALAIIRLWLLEKPTWGESDGFTRESLVEMIEREMDGFTLCEKWEENK